MKLRYRILLGVAVFFIVIIVLGSLASEETSKVTVRKTTSSAVKSSDSTKDISLSQALTKCYKKAEECSEGVPYLKTEYRSVCWQLYYYSGDVDELVNEFDTC